MKRFREVLIIMGALLLITFILSGCNSTDAASIGKALTIVGKAISTNSYEPTWHTLATGITPWLECEGATTNGDYHAQKFSLTVAADVDITIQATPDELPSQYFFVYLMTPEQYSHFFDPQYSSLYRCDLAQSKNFVSWMDEYYLRIHQHLAAGDYYLVFYNGYEQLFRGEYGRARYEIDAYY